MDCLIRIATREDTSAISTVIVSALRQSNAHDYSPEIIARVEHSFAPKAILDLLIQRQVYVATVRGQVVATGSLDRDVVRSVFVDPPHQGTGIGRQLMTMLLAVAASNGIERLRVPSSITAEGFYSSLGFNKIRDEFHGAEHTIIMERMLGPG